MIKLLSPKNDVELAFIRSILDGENIRYFVQNDHFGTMEVGPRIDLFNAKNILVQESDYNRAKELIADYPRTVEGEAVTEAGKEAGYSWKDRLIMLAEGSCSCGLSQGVARKELIKSRESICRLFQNAYMLGVARTASGVVYLIRRALPPGAQQSR